MILSLTFAVLLHAATPREFAVRPSVAWDDELVAALADAIRHAEEDGLDPAAYHLAALATTTGSERDVLASDAFLLLAAHLARGRVDPRSLEPNWCLPAKPFDAAAILQSAIDSRDVATVLARVRPRHPQYARLREALAQYRAIERAGGWEAVPKPRRSLRAGERAPAIVSVRRRVAKEPWAQLSGVDSDLFDAELEAAVKHFQTHYGLAADGVIGRATIGAMNVPVAARVRQLVVALERWRWMPDNLGEPHVIVNIATFRLRIVRNGQTVETMRTVVGKSFTKTPFVASRITEVILNPPWNVPDKIADEELWPKQRRDRGFFAREHIVVRKDGRLQQLAGPYCSLGRIKFNIPNAYDVYLHDTPAKTLFSESRRAFSHGCIRIERPLDLAAELLPDWTREQLQSAIVSGKEITLPVARPLPVYVLYWTAFVDDDGHVDFRDDVYGLDEPLQRGSHWRESSLRHARRSDLAGSAAEAGEAVAAGVSGAIHGSSNCVTSAMTATPPRNARALLGGMSSTAM